MFESLFTLPMTNAAVCVIFLTALKQEEYFYGTEITRYRTYKD